MTVLRLKEAVVVRAFKEMDLLNYTIQGWLAALNNSTCAALKKNTLTPKYNI